MPGCLSTKESTIKHTSTTKRVASTAPQIAHRRNSGFSSLCCISCSSAAVSLPTIGSRPNSARVVTTTTAWNSQPIPDARKAQHEAYHTKNTTFKATTMGAMKATFRSLPPSVIRDFHKALKLQSPQITPVKGSTNTRGTNKARLASAQSQKLVRNFTLLIRIPLPRSDLVGCRDLSSTPNQKCHFSRRFASVGIGNCLRTSKLRLETAPVTDVVAEARRRGLAAGSACPIAPSSNLIVLLILAECLPYPTHLPCQGKNANPADRQVRRPAHPHLAPLPRRSGCSPLSGGVPQ